MKLKLTFLTILTLLITQIHAFSQDIIVFQDGSIAKVKVKKISENQIEYSKFDNLSGPIYTISSEKILSLTYENGSVEKFQAQSKPNQENNATDFEDMKIKGMADATNFYTKSGPGTWSLLSGIFTNYGIGGIIVGLPCALTPPKTHNLNIPNYDLFRTNPTYEQAYREKAFEIKKRKVWKNTLIGVAVGLIATIAYNAEKY